MKMKCIISHEVPLPNGKFIRYEAGQEEEREDLHPYWEPVPPLAGSRPLKKKTEEVKEK